MGKLATLVLKGKSKAPKKGPPNSIYEQLDDTGKVRSRTFYDGNGYPFSRQDFDHSHGGMQPHKHQREFDSMGRLVSKEKVVPLPPEYDNHPTNS